ncbi:MAG: AgmX/PglI C-terminal domain-containing protein [Deltaproteobacteria bacterium]|nr:AgmX/PglI C-terminal domain-containing protein [Deltaproteobacteria bacterium]
MERTTLTAPVALPSARSRPLRIVHGPDGRPRLLRRGAAAFAALRTNLPKVLRVGVIQGARITEERMLRERDQVTIGRSEKADFAVDSPTLPGRFPLFERRVGPDGTSWQLNLMPGMTGRVAFPADQGGVLDLEKLVASGRAEPGPHGVRVPVTTDCRGKVVVGDTTLLFQFVVAPPVQPPPQLPASVRGGWIARLDPRFALSLGVAALLHFGLMGFTMVNDWPEPTLEETLEVGWPVQFQPLVVESETTTSATADDEPAAQGATAAKADGAEPGGKPDEPGATAATDGDPVKPDPGRPAQPVVRHAFGDESLTDRELAKLGDQLGQALELQNILAGGRGPAMGVGVPFDGTSGAIVNLRDSLVGTTVVGDGDRQGGYTVYSDAASVGPAVGPVGPGTTSGPVAVVVPDRGDATDVAPQAIVTGTVRTTGTDRLDSPGVMSGTVFRATLERKRRQVEACYNQVLPRDPTLAGSVRLVVTINPQGGVRIAVESTDRSLEASGVTACIVQRLGTLNFASTPPQGGELRVRVGYDFVAP